MQEIQYIGEHLWIGKIGHLAIVLSFVSSLFAAIAYIFHVQKKKASWRTLGRTGFIIHGLSIFTVVGLLFYAMVNHYYEYSYVFQHVSDDLPMRYVVSAFWEGQEGSFLLWCMWHIVLGFFLIYRGTSWESPVMVTIAIAEAFLCSMLLGVHIEIGDWATKLGSNPTLLLRDTMAAPIFSNADYLSLISGNGLNPLLQNYWMTIHPPVTFLGFASTIMPFGFAVAGLWTRQYTEWLKPALPWALFSAAILGTGILMGSVWAYEALSFGGFWAWDPVENAVLVPWLTLVAGIHTHLIAKSTGYSIRATVFFYIISFPLIVYSTFLTRSGILGDTSAHSFTEMGLEKQLIAFVLFFTLGGLFLLIAKRKKVPVKPTEEQTDSREFWMFIGSLVLLFSALLIGVPTSLPVFNTIASSFDENFVGRVIQEPIPFYNKFQLWIAVFIGILSGFAIFLRYRETNGKKRFKAIQKHLFIAGLGAALFTILTSWWINLYTIPYYVLCFTAWFTAISNADYLITALRHNLKMGSSAIAHLGFGLMVIGILGSGLNEKMITNNPFLFKGLFEEKDLYENVQLIKDKPLFSQGYLLTYTGDTLIDRTRYYDVLFQKLNEENEVINSFTLHPNAVYSNDFSKVAAFNPDTKHYLHKDIFACLTSLAPTKMDVERARQFEDTLKWTSASLPFKDTLYTADGYWLYLDSIHYNPTHPDYEKDVYDFGIEAVVQAGEVNQKDKSFEMATALGLQGSLLYKFPRGEEDLGLRVRLADEAIDQVFTSEDRLDYQTFTVENFKGFEFEDMTINLVGFDREPKDRNYEPQPEDIAIGAKLMAVKDGKSYGTTPVYVIRQNQPMGIKSYIPELGLHLRFSDIDPENEIFTFKVARDQRKNLSNILVEYVENVPRADYLILTASVFPGINLFWLGTVLMMLALFMAWIVRMKK